LSWPVGKVLGGSSSINGLVYVRGQRQDYERWARSGNAGWDWPDVLSYFRKAETQQRGEDEYHGIGGPLGVCDVDDPSAVFDAYIEAAQELGIPANPDFNGHTQEGIGYYQMTVSRGRRCSTAAYLRDAGIRPNLTIRTGALVRRVLFDRLTAVGVEVTIGDRTVPVRAGRLVVLTAGALNTPKLLQLSGIGPEPLLRRHRIPVVQAMRAVGRHLQDHAQVRLIYESRPDASWNVMSRRWSWCIRSLAAYLFLRKGPLTFGAARLGMFARVRPDATTPDVQFHFMPFSADAPGQPLHAFPALTISVCQLRPASEGSLEIASRNPASPPAIRCGYFANGEDLLTTIAGVRLARVLSRRPVLAGLVGRELVPGAIESESELECFVRSTAATLFHPCGTCRMGVDDDAVVSPELRVHGVANLVVADASIMPSIVSGNTNAAVVMIAEKAADLIHSPGARPGASSVPQAAALRASASAPIRPSAARLAHTTHTCSA
jgi:choline dehydrogenase